MTAPRDPHHAAHPIQVAARRTGLSTYVLRAWEQRYRVVSPQRSPSGRRLYSDADIERLQLLQFATRAGRRIGDVAGLAREDLVSLCAADSFATAPGARDPPPSANRELVNEYCTICMDAIHAMSPSSLEATLDNASVVVSMPVLLEDILSPILHNIGMQCRDGALRIGEEHMATGVIRSFLGTLKFNRNLQPADPRVIMATPAGHKHELGALMAAVTAASEGWNAIYLGADTPADEIAAAAVRTQAKAVALSIIYTANDERLTFELKRLRRQLGIGVAILVGGIAARSCRPLLEEIGAVWLNNLKALRDALIALDQLRRTDV
jgi:MerR family transcriptional regulator, light-induced transcriptional regulator